MSRKFISAFPVPNGVQWHATQFPQVGMTLRDYFAAQAMQVMITNDETTFEEDAESAYMIADKMLEAREK